MTDKLTWPAKHPDSELEYKVDWSQWLDGDTIEAAEFTVISGGVVIESQTHDDTSATVVLSGGRSSRQNRLLGQKPNIAVVSCAIVTAADRSETADVEVEIK